MFALVEYRASIGVAGPQALPYTKRGLPALILPTLLNYLIKNMDYLPAQLVGNKFRYYSNLLSTNSCHVFISKMNNLP